MPSSWTAADAFDAATLVGAAGGATAEGALGGSGAGEQAASAKERTGTSKRSVRVMGFEPAKVNDASVPLRAWLRRDLGREMQEPAKAGAAAAHGLAGERVVGKARQEARQGDVRLEPREGQSRAGMDAEGEG